MENKEKDMQEFDLEDIIREFSDLSDEKPEEDAPEQEVPEMTEDTEETGPAQEQP